MNVCVRTFTEPVDGAKAETEGRLLTMGKRTYLLSISANYELLRGILQIVVPDSMSLLSQGQLFSKIYQMDESHGTKSIESKLCVGKYRNPMMLSGC